MKFTWYRGALVAAAFVLPLSAKALTPAEALKNLEKAAAAQPSEGRISKTMIPYWKKALEEENYAALEQMELLGMGGDEAESAALHAPLSAFAESVRHAKKERAKAEASRFETLLAQAGKAIEKAKTAKDLDATVKALATAQSPRFFSSEESQNLQQQLQTSRQIVSDWQVYLNEMGADRPDRAIKPLENISDSLTKCPLVPRSKVLAMLAQLPRGEKPGTTSLPKAPPYTGPTLESIEGDLAKNLDIDAALKAIGDLPSGQRSSSSHYFAESLRKFKNFQASTGSRSVEDVIKEASRYSSNSPLMPVYYFEINKLIAATWKVPPAAKHLTTEMYVRTIIQEATAHDNWDLARKGWSVASELRLGQSDEAAISQYLKGLEFEKVGMWVQAIRAYRSGLNSKLVYMPIGKFTARLQAMKKADPNRYEQANAEADALERLEKAQMLSNYLQRYPSTPATSDETIEVIRRELSAALEERKPTDAAPKEEPAKPATVPESAPAPK
jgi:hypothetical protein